MAIAFTSKVAGSDAVDRSTYTTGTYTPSASGVMVIVSFSHSASASIADATSVTGTSVTGMTKIITRGLNSTASPTRKVEIWVGTSTASAGTVAIAAASNTSCAWSITEVTGADVTQGTGGVIQSVADSNSSAANTAFTITLASFANSNNRGWASGCNTNTPTITLSGTSPYAAVDANAATPPDNNHATIKNQTDSGVTAAGTWSTSGQWGGVAIEIAADLGSYVPPKIVNPVVAVHRAANW